MAKYRITSIPQYRNGGKKKKQQPVIQSGWNSPVEGFEPNSPLSAFIPNQSMVEQPTQYTIDPNQQDVPLSQRTGLEQLATQPEFGNVGYGYKRNRFTGGLDLVPAGTPTYEKDLFGRTITEVQANPDAPVTYTGQELNCGPGKRPYKGVCLTDEEYAQVQAKEEANISYWDQEERKKIAEEEEKARKKAEEDYINEFNAYVKNATAKGNKHKKGVLDPFRTYSKDVWEGHNFDAWYNDPENGGGKLYYKQKKDLGDGNYEIQLYPREAIETMMSKYGVQPGEFERYHGLNAKELQKEYDPYLKYLHNYYLAQGQDFIKKYTEQGLSAEEAKKKLIRDKGYGVTSGIEKNFKDVADMYDFENNAEKYFVDDQGVMYTRDRSGNVYRYTNDPQNKDFKVFNYNSTDGDSSPFSENNYSNQGVFTWEPVDKSEFKLNNDGSLNVNGRQATLFDYNFKGRDKKKDENTILTNYKDYINKGSKEIAESNKFYNVQGAYQSYNNQMFDHVYGNSWTSDLPEISLVDQLNTGAGLNNQYVTEYNNAVKKLNAITKGKDISSNPDYYRKQKAKIVEDFINKVQGTGTKVGDKKVDFGSLTGYQETFAGRDVSAYKDAGKLKQQRDFTTNEEATNLLRYAYLNNINPNEATVVNDQYRGEKDNWNSKYLNYYQFAQSPEGQKFLKTYKQQPSYGRTLLDEANYIKESNLAQDKYKKQAELAKQRLYNMQENMPWYGLALDQGMALLTQPVDTISDWTSGKLQDPLIGVIGDQPTTADLKKLDEQFGTGAAQAYIDNVNDIYANPVAQAVNLFNPLYFAGETGRGLGRKWNGDPEANWGDIGLNAAFALLPVSKTAKALYGAKLLSPMAKYVPAALKAGKYIPRVGNALTHAVTPGNALNAYFMNHAFVPHTNPITGETEQGFAVDAAKETWEGLTNQDGIDWSKITPNLLNLYMGYHIGAHGLGTANQFAGNLLGKPSLLNTSKLTQPITDPLQNLKYNLTNPPQPYLNPGTGNINFIRSKSDLPFLNSNRFGLNYKQKGGPVLPKAAYGKEKKSTEKVEVKIPEPSIKEQISKSLADLSFTNYLNSTAPETMALIAELKNKNIISPTLSEGQLVTYPNLLNLATKKGIQDKLTLVRSAAGTDYGISSSGTKTELAPGDLEAYRKFGITTDPVGKGLYGMTHVPWMRYGQRTGLYNLPYQTQYVKVYKFGEGEADYVVADNLDQAREVYKIQVGGDPETVAFTPDTIKQATPDSYDALYTYGDNTGIPRSVRRGVFDDQYGTYTGILRYPFDYSGSAFDMFGRFNALENETFPRARLLRSTAGREGATSGALGAFTLTDKATLENSFISPLFASNETPVIGKPGEKLLEPVAVYHKPELAELDKERDYAHDLYTSGKYNELIEHLNNRIKQGQFGNIESNIQRIKEKPEFTTFEFDAGERNRMADNLYMNGIINPETGLIDTNLTGAELEKLANLAYQSYNNYLYFGPRENAYYNKANVEKIPYSPFRFKFKEGGELPEARYGRPVKLSRNIPKPKPREIKFENMVAKTNYWPDLTDKNFTIPKPNVPNEFTQWYWDKWNSLPETGFHKTPTPIRPKLDSYSLDLLKYPDLDITTGESGPALTSPIETSNYLGDFHFKDFSDGWQVRNDMMNAFDKPQWAASNKDFFSRLEFNDLLMKQLEYDMARMKFDEIHPEDPANMLLDALRGEPNRRDEDFANLFPGIGLPNWRSKFTTPEQESFLRERVMDYNPTVRQMGKLNPASLKTLNVGLDTLPKTYKDLVNQSKADTWLKTAPAKDVVSEMRGGLGVKLTDIQNATPEQLEAWRQQIIKKMYNQVLQRWNNDISTPFKGSDAWREISNQAGYKNKNGGVSMKLSKAEIDKYVKGGYIVEEE